VSDPRLTDHRFVELDPQPTIAVRIRRPMADVDMSALFSTYLPRLFQQLEGLGRPPAGAPFGRYHRFGPDEADVEIGVPVAAPPPGVPPLGAGESDEIGTSELPGVAAAVVVHHGTYDTLGEAYGPFYEWIEKQGREPGTGAWESYIDDPEEVQNPATIRTEIYWPLA
jgi:effector-binding domain-containing protein